MEKLNLAYLNTTTEEEEDFNPPHLNVKMVSADSAELQKTVRGIQDYLLDRQLPDGEWMAELEANAFLNAEYIMLMHFLEDVNQDVQRRMADYLLNTQLPEGGWPVYYGGPPHLSTSVEAYFSLKLAGIAPDRPEMERARNMILSLGGVAQCQVITRINLALFGQYDWEGTPRMPIELMFMPRVSPINIYEMSCWARTCVVPLLILCTLRPRCEIPAEKGVRELYLQPPSKSDYSLDSDIKLFSWKNFFKKADGLLKFYEKSPVKMPRKTALRMAKKWIIDHQDKSGDWCGIYPAMAYSIMALKSMGHKNTFQPIRKGMEAIRRFHLEKKEGLYQQSCISPVWDTAWAAMALSESGIRSEDPALKRSHDWLFRMQIDRPGDWAVKNPLTEPGGWAFEYHNDFYPDNDDTAVVLMALLYSDLTDPENREKFERGLRWVLSMQNDDFGWGAFERNIDNKLFNEIPFNDQQNMLDPSTADVTARVVEMAGRTSTMMGRDIIQAPSLQSALEFLHQEQETYGPWFGRWGVNYIYGTWSVHCALEAAGHSMRSPAIHRSVKWLKSIQNPDGGWGESCKSYEDSSWIGRGESCASQTAWAVMALVSAGEAKSFSVQSGIRYLIDTQTEAGTWEEEPFTGTGFPGSFYIRYHMYPEYFPLLALARYTKAIRTGT